MARSKRPISNPHAPSRAAVRRRNTEIPPENLTRDLNEPPPVSGENPATSGAPMTSGAPDEGSSKQESPKAVSSSHVSTTNTSLFDTETLQTEEEEKRLEEEYMQRKEAIRKRREDAERRRREEEERVRKEEEEKRLEEARVKAEKEQILEEERRQAEADVFEEDQKLLREVEEGYQNQYEKFVFDKEKNVVSGSAHSGENPIPQVAKQRRVVTRSTVVAKARKTPTKRPARKTSRKGKNPATSLSAESMEIDGGDEQIQSQNPHHSTVGTEHAPSGVPRQFTSPEVAAHFEYISTQKLKLERGFDPDFVEANPFVKDRIVVHDWSIITASDRRANASLVREFYAEASQSKDPVVTVRGRRVCYNPREINRVLGRGNPGICEFSQFLKKMTPACEDLILKEIAAEGKPWNKDGQRRCLNAGSLTTEAAIWFQFLRASLSPTSHDTTLSMHKCVLLYCILTGKRINVGVVMHGAIDQARTRKKVILPLPCLITSLMIDAGVPSAVEDQWLDATSDINVGTIKKMKRHVTTPPPEQAEEVPTVGTVHPTVFIADEHVVGADVPTVEKTGTPLRPSTTGKAGTSSVSPMTAILQAISSLTYKVDLLAAEQKHINRALEAVWMYNRDRDGVVNQMYMAANPLLAAQIPEFPEGICPTVASEDAMEEEEDEGETDSSPSSAPSA